MKKILLKRKKAKIDHFEQNEKIGNELPFYLIVNRCSLRVSIPKIA